MTENAELQTGQNPSHETTTQEDQGTRGQLKWNEQRSSEATPSSSDSDGASGKTGGSDWLGGPQNGNEIPGNGGNGGGNGGNGGNAYGSGNAGSGGNGGNG